MVSEFFELRLWATDEHDEGEIAAEHGHAGVFDVTLMSEDECGDLVDDAGTILADSGDNQVTTHKDSLSIGRVLMDYIGRLGLDKAKVARAGRDEGAEIDLTDD